jgi:hypothetical protein
MVTLVISCSPGGGGSGSSGGGSTNPPPPTTPIISISVSNALPLTGYVGQTTNYTVTISSGSGITATLNGITLSNTNGFALTTNCPATLTAYAYCTGTLAFTPTATGAYSTAISVADNAPGSPQTLAITAQATDAPLPGFSLSPSTLTFSNVIPNTTSASQTVLLANSSVAALNITSIAITGANATSFGETNNCPATVVAGSICMITVTMQPTAANTSYSAALTVIGNAGSSTGITQSVALTGTSGASAPAPQIAISPASLDFTGTLVGASVMKSITLTNHGTSALTINSITISGSTNFIPQTSAITCGTSLAAGASCTYTVDFYAAAMGSFSGTLLITDNALGSPQTVPLTGSGVEAIASFTNGPVSFTNVAANTSSQPFNLELENTGNIALAISSLTLAPSTPSVFSETNTCGTSLAPNALCTLTVNFKPTAAATAYATYLTLDSNASPAQQTVTVTGTSSGYAVQTALYVEPTAGYTWLYTLVNGATSSIDLAASQLVDTTLLADLTADCKRGVRVRAILTDNASSVATAYSTLNSSGANCSAVYSALPLSDQSSFVVDDSQIAILTGTLTTSTYATLRDYAWLTNDPRDIAAANATFSLDYAGTTPATYTPSVGTDLYWTPDTDSRLATIIGAAQYSLFIESETISSTAIVNAIIQDCTNANLAVELVLGANDSDTPLQQLNEYCPNTIVVNQNVHGTVVMVDGYALQSATGAALIAPMPLDDTSLQSGRSLGVFVTGSSNLTTLMQTIDTDAATGIPYIN